MRRVLLPLTALRAFEAAARHRSFKRAAAELGVTPTAISHQIRELEQSCGRPLFRRHPRPLDLTEAGAGLFPVLRAGFDSFAAAIAALHGAAGQPAPLRVTTTNAFAHLWLVPRLARWRAAHPDIALEVHGTDQTLDVAGGEADLAIRYAWAAPPGLVAEELLRDRFWPMASPDLLPGGQAVAGAAELLRHPLIHLAWYPHEKHAPTWPRWFEAARHLDPALPEEAGTGGGLFFREELHGLEAAVAGQGIVICSDLLAERELAAGRLVRAHALALPGFGFWLAHRAGHPRQAAIEAFAAWARSAAAAPG